MGNVLLVVPADCGGRTALHEAISETRRGEGKLVVAVVVDPQVCERVSESLSETGLVGERISSGVCSTIMREYEQRARALADELTASARAEGIDVEGAVEHGETSEICSRLVRERQIASALLVAERRSWLGRLLSGGPLQMPALPGCDVRVVEED